MLLQRSFGLIIIVAVASTMGVYRINELGPDDESYLQPTSEFAVTVAMISSVRTILKPSLSKSDIKKGTRFLKSIKFFCYMDRLITKYIVYYVFLFQINFNIKRA